MAHAKFEYVPHDKGVLLRLKSRNLFGAWDFIVFSEWEQKAPPESKLGLARILSALDRDDRSVEDVNDGLMLTYELVAHLEEHQAIGLGLPPAVPYLLEI